MSQFAAWFADNIADKEKSNGSGHGNSIIVFRLFVVTAQLNERGVDLDRSHGN